MVAPRIVGLGGTFSRTSTTTSALRVVLDAASRHGALTDLIEVGSLGLPHYEWGLEAPRSAVELAGQMHAADALVWASPLYHGTVSGLFKNAIDWLEILRDRTPVYLTDKPVGLIGVAAGGHALAAIGTMEQIVRSLRGWTVPLVVPINRASEVFERDGGVRAGPVAEQLELLGAEMVRAAHRFRREP